MSTPASQAGLTLVEKSSALASPDYLPAVDPAAVEQAMMIGDLSQMSPEVRIAYYVAVCKSLGLNPLTKPFQAFKNEDGTVILYPDKGCAEQLRKRDGVSMRIVSRDYVDDLYIVTAEASTPDGRKEEAEGVVVVMETAGSWEEGTKRDGSKYRFKRETVGPDGQPVLKRISGTAMAAARMRAETKAKRRATLAICGLGMPESEGGHPMRFDPHQGTLDAALVDDTLRLGSVDTSSAATKTLQDHISDLFGDEALPTGPPALHPLWASIKQWYDEAGRTEDYEKLVPWVLKRYHVATLQAISLPELEQLAQNIYARFEPLILARKMNQTPTETPEERPPSVEQDGSLGAADFAWQTLERHKDNADLPVDLVERIQAALSPLARATDAEAHTLASEVLDVLDSPVPDDPE